MRDVLNEGTGFLLVGGVTSHPRVSTPTEVAKKWHHTPLGGVDTGGEWAQAKEKTVKKNTPTHGVKNPPLRGVGPDTDRE